MRLHGHAVEKILNILQAYGGHETDAKLRAQLENLDFSPYERKSNGGEVILVLTEELAKQLSGNPVR